MVKKIMVLAAGVLALSGIAAAQPANAAGCLKGAVAGGVIGHFAGHHGLVGAGIGCAYGHHEAARRDEMRRDRYDNRY